MKIGRMLLASVVAGIAAPWPILLFFMIVPLFDKPADDQIYALPLSVAIAGGLVGLGLYFPYGFVREAKRWGWSQDIVIHLIASSVFATLFVFRAMERVGSTAEVVVQAMIGSCIVMVVALPSPMIFAFLMRATRLDPREG